MGVDRPTLAAALRALLRWAAPDCGDANGSIEKKTADYEAAVAALAQHDKQSRSVSDWQRVIFHRDRLHEVLHDPDGGDAGDECDAAGNLVDAIDAFRASHGDP
ncbi:hypothetical protein A7X61_20575 [Stenotrophomonas maltophilia]|uniref:hypothetical protein n=1 Tax=Stenotrophomonas maltophilia TaxID=40324 RepID=UPI000DA7AFC9|nr:hypothetical protein [Stenotrophomonas maltophilia]PZS48456.1 hypothetical protein A7X61_20575 [Stenotrophomonas maltophilia]